MRVGIVGAGRIGGNAARLLAAAGHEVRLSFARDRARLAALAGEIGERASIGTPAEVVAFGEVVIFAVPWDLVPLALEQAGDLTGKIVVDTTNQFGSGPMPPAGQTAAQYNAARMPGARYTKSFNTRTAVPSGWFSGSAEKTPRRSRSSQGSSNTPASPRLILAAAPAAR
jgi:predicted dinucleotide-binding enzyme